MFNSCKQSITSLSLLVGSTVDYSTNDQYNYVS